MLRSSPGKRSVSSASFDSESTSTSESSAMRTVADAGCLVRSDISPIVSPGPMRLTIRFAPA